MKEKTKNFFWQLIALIARAKLVSSVLAKKRSVAPAKEAMKNNIDLSDFGEKERSLFQKLFCLSPYDNYSDF